MKINEKKFLVPAALIFVCGLYIMMNGYYGYYPGLNEAQTRFFTVIGSFYLIFISFFAFLLRADSEKNDFPALKRVYLCDEHDTERPAEEGRYEVAGKVKIKVEFEGYAEEIHIFMMPQREGDGLRKQIGYLTARGSSETGQKGFQSKNGIAEFIWDVPSGEWEGYPGVELINGNKVRYEPNALKLEQSG